jgi:NAD(P) transhydrogenase
MNYDIIIIGNDPAGIETAFAAAASNLRTAIVLSEPDVVLACTEQLCDALSILVPELAVSRICGTGAFAPTNQFTMDDVRGELQSVIDDQRAIALERLNAHGVDTILGDARFVDKHTIAVGPVELTADRFVIATGTRPGSTLFTDGDNVTNAIQLLQRKEIPDSLAVIGGNRIGMQLGLLFAGIGSAVTIIDGRPLVHCGIETDLLIDRALELGVDFRLGSSMISADIVAENEATHVSVHLENGERMLVDLTLLAKPSLGNTDGLGLENIGLEADESSRLWCNDQLQTWQPHIHAIGNVVGYPIQTDVETSLQILSASFKTARQIPRPMGLLQSLTRKRTDINSQASTTAKPVVQS